MTNAVLAWAVSAVSALVTASQDSLAQFLDARPKEVFWVTAQALILQPHFAVAAAGALAHFAGEMSLCEMLLCGLKSNQVYATVNATKHHIPKA